MKSEKFDEGKDLSEALPGEIFIFAMQGFVAMGESLLSENLNSKAQYYIEPGKDMILKLSTMFELEPDFEPYSNEAVVHTLYTLREEERNFAVKMVLEFVQGIELTMTKNPILASQKPNVLRNYEIISKMIEETNELSKRWTGPKSK